MNNVKNVMSIQAPPLKYDTWSKWFLSWNCLACRARKEVAKDLKKRNLQYLKDAFELKITEKSLKDRNVDIDFTEELTVNEILTILAAYQNQLKPKYKTVEAIKLAYTWGQILWLSRRLLCFTILVQIWLHYLSVESSTSPSLNIKSNNIQPPKLTIRDFQTGGHLSHKINITQPCGGIKIRGFKCVPNDYKYPPYNFLKLITEVTQERPNRFVYRPVYRLPYTVVSGFDPKEELVYDEKTKFFKKVQIQGSSTVGFITSKFYNIFSPNYPLTQTIRLTKDKLPVIAQNVPEDVLGSIAEVLKKDDSFFQKNEIVNAEDFFAANLILGNQNLSLDNVMVQKTGHEKKVILYPSDLSHAGYFLEEDSLRAWFERTLAGNQLSKLPLDLGKLSGSLRNAQKRLKKNNIESIMKKSVDSLEKNKMDLSWHKDSVLHFYWMNALSTRVKLLENIIQSLDLEDAIRKGDFKSFQELFNQKRYAPEGKYHWLIPDCNQELSSYKSINLSKSNLVTPLQLINIYAKEKLLSRENYLKFARFIKIKIISQKQTIPFTDTDIKSN